MVLERLPATLEPRAGAAEADDVNYDARGLTLRVTAPHGATLTVAAGPSANYVVQIGAEPPQAIAAEKGVLRVSIGAGRGVPVKIQGR